MAYLKYLKKWEIPEREATPEHIYWNRRQFIKALGLGGLALTGLTALNRFNSIVGAEGTAQPTTAASPAPGTGVPPLAGTPIPVPRNPKYTLDRPLTDEQVATQFNNFYEFTQDKDTVWTLVDRFETRPWEVEVAGLVEKPKVYDIDELIRSMPLEERLYRFRCVETWAMAVPWTGFPMKALIDQVQPKSTARYIHFTTFFRPDQAPGQKERRWPWPYSEGLTMEEALNELTLLATGLYGKELPKQNGAPVRLVVPWKYGYKSIKSIVKIEFTDVQPPTFWNTLSPEEYPFQSNVEPDVPHPRWPQDRETMIGTGEKRDTLLYNGYDEFVAPLYKK